MYNHLIHSLLKSILEYSICNYQLGSIYPLLSVGFYIPSVISWVLYTLCYQLGSIYPLLSVGFYIPSVISWVLYTLCYQLGSIYPLLSVGFYIPSVISWVLYTLWVLRMYVYNLTYTVISKQYHALPPLI